MKHPPAEFLYMDAGLHERSRYKAGRTGMLRLYRTQASDGFTCKHCGWFVSAITAVSGVINRNHCPYCLWSRHLDLFQAGDRLCACKASMRPVGLALKKTRKKYGRAGLGELLLVHLCIECAEASLNRLAADDDPEVILKVFEGSLRLGGMERRQLADGQIEMLDEANRGLVMTQLFGWQTISAD